MDSDFILIMHILKQLYCGDVEETIRSKRGNQGTTSQEDADN